MAVDGAKVAGVERNQPAEGVLVPGDVLTKVDGRTGDRDQLSQRIASHRCEGRLVRGCEATTPVSLTILRDGRTITEDVTPLYDPKAKKMRIGFTSEVRTRDAGVGDALTGSLDRMWFVTTTSVDRIVGIFDAESSAATSTASSAPTRPPAARSRSTSGPPWSCSD